MVQDCGLLDMSLLGHQFTWYMREKGVMVIEERLDRVFVTPAWLSLFSSASLLNLIAVFSDHSPLLLVFEERIRHERVRRFRFEKQWLQEEGLADIVMDC